MRYAFDFGSFARPPSIRTGDAGLVTEQVVWAREADGVLYVETAHQTYAESSGGLNGYLTAVSIRTERILWRSPSLVANASDFVLAGDVLVSGYGFTKEPDFLYVLDRRTGRALNRLAVPSAPERIVRHGNRLAVRTYDHTLVVELRRR
jgi:outer membrane protein assembly factor BamB